MEISQTVLKNNINVLFINSPGSQAATVQVWFRAGSVLEEDSEQGIAHFLEHMFFKGTSTRPGSQLAYEVESYGAEVNAFTSFDYTCYYINTPNSQLEKSTEILLDMVSNPQFQVEELVPEREVVFEEFLRSVDNPSQYSFAKIQSACFQNGYKHQILGNETTIKNFSREQLISFRSRFYNQENALLVIGGDLAAKKDKIIDLIENFSLPSGASSQFPAFTLKDETTLDYHTKEVKMAQITLSIEAPCFEHADAPAEDIAINCLGNGETSRLYQSLVLDTTLANYASSSTMFMNNGGIHFCRFSFPITNLSKVLKKASEVLEQSLDKKVEEWEVQKIVNQYVASKIYEKESLESFAFNYGHSYAQSKDIYSDEKFIEKIKQTSASEVTKAFKRIFSRPIHISVQLPIGEDKKTNIDQIKKFHKQIGALKNSIDQKKVPYKIQDSKFDPQIKVIKLKDGVNLFYRQNKMTPTFVFHSYIRGGITEETIKNNGINNLLSSMLTKGYDNVSHDDLKKYLEDRSASINGFAGKNAYGLTMHGLSNDFTTLTKHFFGTMLRPKMPAKYLTHEKTLSLRTLENQKEDPSKQCFQNVSRLMFGQHPYSYNIVGNVKALKSITVNQILKFHQDALNKNEMLLTYCGDLDLDEVLATLEDYLPLIKPRKSTTPKLKKIAPLTEKSFKLNFNREQTHIFIGLPTAKLSDKSNIYLKILTAHLSGQSSELFTDIRDKQGLCYSVSPVHFNAIEGGYWGIYMASGTDKVPQAISSIHKIIENIATNGLTENDFERIKVMLEGQNQVNIQTNEDYANIFSVPILQRLGVDFHFENHKEIKDMNYHDFQNAIKKVINPKKLKSIVVGKNQ